jgi:citrate lyase subunit beta / citryl-CoA lyase
LLLRSLLFVPGDRPERFYKAAASGADAIILDLEDSVSPSAKAFARDAVTDWLAAERAAKAFVRINALLSEHIEADLAAILEAEPDGIILPKSEGASSIRTLQHLAEGRELPPILPIGTETAAAMFEFGSYQQISNSIVGLTWGAEDLAASVGALQSRTDDGNFTAPYEIARAFTLFGAHAAGVAAIETVCLDVSAGPILTNFVARARRDGFNGMMAIHPAQVPVITHGFTPMPQEVDHARAVIAAFAENPGVGALKLNNKMIDRPHLLQARRILELVDKEVRGCE